MVQLFAEQRKIKKNFRCRFTCILVTEAQYEHGKCFYVGACLSTLNKIHHKLNGEYPNIKFSSYSPPFKSEFSKNETMEMIKMVNGFGPNLLFVGITAPKQEKWVNENRKFLKVNVVCSIGAVFDFYAGTIHRPNKLMIGLGLEWFGRFLSEPQRMRKRYFYYGPIFVFRTIMEKLRCTFSQKRK